MRLSRVIAGVVAMVAVSSFTTVLGASPPTGSATIVADLEGRPIKAAAISNYYCHDFDFPAIHCYGTPDRLKGAEAARASSGLATTAAFGPNDYVTIFDGPTYSGAFMDVSQNYDALFSIGWNDRITSFKARNSASGEFWTDWFASGFGRSFCCNVWVASLPSGQDNAFSSLYRH